MRYIKTINRNQVIFYHVSTKSIFDTMKSHSIHAFQKKSQRIMKICLNAWIKSLPWIMIVFENLQYGQNLLYCSNWITIVFVYSIHSNRVIMNIFRSWILLLITSFWITNFYYCLLLLVFLSLFKVKTLFRHLDRSS